MERTINGVSIHYEVMGQGRPMLMLHGNGESGEIFTEAAERLKERFTLYLVDSRGHGQSSSVSAYHYADMAQDMHDLIVALRLDKPILYGFSDGGIVGLIMVIRWPDLLSVLIVSGANIAPIGLSVKTLFLCWMDYFKDPQPLKLMMLTEPHIPARALKTIKTPTYVLAGSSDLITFPHTKRIARAIPHSVLKIFEDETHGSYIVHSTKIADYIFTLPI